jgi:hypothetical protein
MEKFLDSINPLYTFFFLRSRRCLVIAQMILFKPFKLIRRLIDPIPCDLAKVVPQKLANLDEANDHRGDFANT